MECKIEQTFSVCFKVKFIHSTLHLNLINNRFTVWAILKLLLSIREKKFNFKFRHFNFYLCTIWEVVNGIFRTFFIIHEHSFSRD